MIKTKFTFERWARLSTSNMAAHIVSDRLREATRMFLVSNKLVTKNFKGPGENYELTSCVPFREVRRLYRIILANVLKRLPIIRNDNFYEVPFITLNSSSSIFTICLAGTPRDVRVVQRYIRFLKIREHIDSVATPFAIEVSSGHQEFLAENLGERASIYISMFIGNERRYLPYGAHLYTFTFLIPAILKIISTLHRKAYFKDNTYATNTPSTSSSTATIGIDIPF